jgi:beta-glucanase (GH16 family)
MYFRLVILTHVGRIGHFACHPRSLDCDLLSTVCSAEYVGEATGQKVMARVELYTMYEKRGGKSTAGVGSFHEQTESSSAERVEWHCNVEPQKEIKSVQT